MDGSVLKPSEGQPHHDHFSSFDTWNDPYDAERGLLKGKC